MVRTVNAAAHTARRTAILDAAERMVATKGYEQMAIGDVLAAVGISSGAFYHYFDSKPALLWALVDRRGVQSVQAVLPIVEDATLDALDKLKKFFDTLDAGKLANKDLIEAYVRVWYADDNAILRHKLYLGRIERLAPLLEQMILQGVAESVFSVPYPDHTARHIISLLEDLGYATATLFLEGPLTPAALPRLQTTGMATVEAIERLLGLPSGSLWAGFQTHITAWVAPDTNSL